MAVTYVVHFDTTQPRKGYISGYPSFACGIESEFDSTELEHAKAGATNVWAMVTCDWCRVAQNKKKDEPVTRRELDERIVNMTFNNDFDSPVVQAAIEKGIAAGVDKAVARISKDFEEARYALKGLVSDGVEVALQRGSVKQNLVGIHKIAEDELDSEFDVDESDENQLTLMKQAVREVLKERDDEVDPYQFSGKINDVYALFEQEGFKRRMRKMAEEGAAQALQKQSAAGVGTTEFTQNVYSPEALSPIEIYRAHRLVQAAKSSGTVVNVTDYHNHMPIDDKKFRREFKDAVKEATREYEDETLDAYNKEEKALMQVAVASILTSEEFQGLFKKLVKDAIEEKDAVERQRAAELNRVLWERALQPYPMLGGVRNLSAPYKSMAVEDCGDVIEGFDHKMVIPTIKVPSKQPVHYRRLYRMETACYLNAGADDLATTIQRSKVTCRDCKTAANI